MEEGHIGHKCLRVTMEGQHWPLVFKGYNGDLNV